MIEVGSPSADLQEKGQICLWCNPQLPSFSPREGLGLVCNVFAQSLQTANVMQRDGEGASERRKESN